MRQLQAEDEQHVEELAGQEEIFLDDDDDGDASAAALAVCQSQSAGGNREEAIARVDKVEERLEGGERSVFE